jgi:Mitochondrial carrier protein
LWLSLLTHSTFNIQHTILLFHLIHDVNIWVSNRLRDTTARTFGMMQPSRRIFSYGLLLPLLLRVNEVQSFTAVVVLFSGSSISSSRSSILSPPPTPPPRTSLSLALAVTRVASTTTTTRESTCGSPAGHSSTRLLVRSEEDEDRHVFLDSNYLVYQQTSPNIKHALDDDAYVEGDELISRRLFLGTIVATGCLAAATSESAQASTTSSATSIKSEGSASSSMIVSAASVAATAATSTTAGSVMVPSIDWSGIFQKASKKALGGGKAGAAAAVVQVCSLMWLRTSMNYQYRYGGNLTSSLSTLWNEGGISRLYQGLPFALLQGPLTRFGDTAANVGILVLLDSLDATRDLPLPLKTAAGSAAAGLWRIVLMPIDASKTAMQVEGQAGLERLWQEVTTSGGAGPGALYRGALAQAAATAAGHYPWFLTYNALNSKLPPVTAESDLLLSLARSALLGLVASCVSDCVSNSLRVIKTTKQTAQLGTIKEDDEAAEKTGNAGQKELSYPEVVAMIIEQDGLAGLFGRGLQTRLLTNAIQGAVFSVLWRYFQEVGFMQ